MSFRRRLALVSAAAVAVAIVLASGIVYLVVRGELREQVDSGLEELADRASIRAVAAPAPTPGTGPGGAPPLPIPTDRQRRPDTIELALPEPPLGTPTGVGQLISADGDVLRAAGEGLSLPVSDAAREVAAGERGPLFEDLDVGGSHVRVLTTAIAPGEAVQVARSLEETDATLRRLALVLGLVSVGGIALAAGLGWIVSRTAIGPVERLTSAAEHVTRTRDLGSRIEADGRADELGRLAAAFNAMLEELDDSLRVQRQLVADASHELRTPITSLRTNIEVLAQPNGLPAADRERLLGDVVAQLGELSALVGNLVDLARDEEPADEAEELRLDELVAGAVRSAERNFPEPRFSLRAEPCVVRGSAGRLERAVGNLLDNAAKWSPPGGEIEVAVERGAVSVRDHGPGISADDLPHVFDRFYRAPAARGMTGSGLGLAIVRQVAEAHGGSVDAEQADGGGTLMRLSLPLAGHPGEHSLAKSSPALS